MAKKELSTEDYAYMDLDAAPAELTDTILEARETIIYSESWTVDGQCAIINLDDGTRTPLPEFYDLFPEDWDVPTSDAASAIAVNDVSISPTRWGVLFHDYIKLYAPSNSLTTPFYHFYGGKACYLTIARLIPGSTWNCGYTNAATGGNVGYATDMKTNEALSLEKSSSSIRYGVRASTYSTTGSALLEVGWT